MRRDNLLLSGLVLILLGPFLVFSGDPLLGASGVPISVAGIALLMWGSARSRTVNCPRRPSPPGDPPRRIWLMTHAFGTGWTPRSTTPFEPRSCAAHAVMWISSREVDLPHMPALPVIVCCGRRNDSSGTVRRPQEAPRDGRFVART